jgi:rubrerythrin
MTYKKGKPKFSKDEIIEILKRNVNLFKDEEEFVDYIVDLALYLVEHRLLTQTEASDLNPAKPASDDRIQKRGEMYQRAGRGTSEELYERLKKHSRSAESEKSLCRMCGAPIVPGRATCPNCGNMTF